jgi:hypothetical protein
MCGRYRRTTPEEELKKDTIGAQAGEIAGKDKVDNQIEVKAAKSDHLHDHDRGKESK